MRNMMKLVECRDGRKWEESYRIDGDSIENIADVWKSLCLDLVKKKLEKSEHISKISRENNFDGTYTVVVEYSDKTRATYIIESR